MKEVFLLKAGSIEMLQTGTSASVLNNGNFFEIKDHIKYADTVAREKVKVIMLHTHPVGFEHLSQADIETLTGMRFGLDRNFVAGIVYLNGKNKMRYKLFNIVLINKKAKIVEFSIWKNFVSGFGLYPTLQKLVRLSNYE